MTPQEFADLVAPITRWIGGRALDEARDADLNRAFPPSSVFFRSVLDGCRAGIAAGWMRLPAASGRHRIHQDLTLHQARRGGGKPWSD